MYRSLLFLLSACQLSCISSLSSPIRITFYLTNSLIIQLSFLIYSLHLYYEFILLLSGLMWLISPHKWNLLCWKNLILEYLQTSQCRQLFDHEFRIFKSLSFSVLPFSLIYTMNKAGKESAPMREIHYCLKTKLERRKPILCLPALPLQLLVLISQYWQLH